ncbi:MAG: hypothetical protein K2Y05_08970, partial [Hyphomicrobiaceae bacterium]|nr:hypothetical protein [Hyphomicrobiaceae bacterium]
MTSTFRYSLVLLLAGLWATGALPNVPLLSVAEAATSSQIRDRVLSRVERGRLLRAPSIGTGGHLPAPIQPGAAARGFPSTRDRS